MQFNRETTDALTVRSFEPGRLRVGEKWFTDNLILTRAEVIAPWPISHAGEVSRSSLAPALEQAPEILLIGTGVAYAMCDTTLIGELARDGIGVEFMDTAAACRTFNVLVHEQRSVVAALCLE